MSPNSIHWSRTIYLVLGVVARHPQPRKGFAARLAMAVKRIVICNSKIRDEPAKLLQSPIRGTTHGRNRGSIEKKKKAILILLSRLVLRDERRIPRPCFAAQSRLSQSMLCMSRCIYLALTRRGLDLRDIESSRWLFF